MWMALRLLSSFAVFIAIVVGGFFLSRYLLIPDDGYVDGFDGIGVLLFGIPASVAVALTASILTFMHMPRLRCRFRKHG